MAEIKNEIQYQKLLERIEELLQLVGNATPTNDKNHVELDLISDLVAEYEEKYYSIAIPRAVISNQCSVSLLLSYFLFLVCYWLLDIFFESNIQ